MAWHEYPLQIRMYASMIGADHLPLDQQRAYIIQTLVQKNNKANLNSACVLTAELEWTEENRPYYDLYPSVGEAFTKVNLDKLLFEQIKLPLPRLMIRMPVGKELRLSDKMSMKSMLAFEMPAHRTANGIAGLIVVIHNDLPPVTATLTNGDRRTFAPNLISCVTFAPGQTIADRLRFGHANPYCEDELDVEAVENAFRLVCALALLKDNPDFVEPLPLEADRQKWEATHDPKYIEKAARRHKRAWAIGRHIEAAPGFRNPHFAIRWMGKGRTDPQLRPIKGCLVRRRQVEEVPTDWLGPEETDTKS